MDSFSQDIPPEPVWWSAKPNKPRKVTQPEIYFDKATFIPLRLANEIMAKEKLVVLPTHEIYRWNYDELIYEPAEEHIKAYARFCLQEKATTHNVNETMNQIIDTAPKQDELKLPLELIPFKNVLFNRIDLTTTDYTPDYFIDRKLGAEYDSAMQLDSFNHCPEIDGFLDQVMSQEDKEVFYQFVGYCFHREYPIAIAVMLVGTGGNGKSTALEILTRCIGRENISCVELQDLTDNRFAASRLEGKHANIFADISKATLKDTGKFKVLTGGDQLESERKFKDSHGFYNHAKLIFSANTVPDSKDDTDAFFDRWVVIEFKARFRGTNREIPKTELLDRLCTQEELNGLAMEGLKRLPALLATGHFNRTTNVEKLRETYVRASDPIGAFSMECIAEVEGHDEPKDIVFKAYVRYCLDRQLVRRDKDVFCKLFETKRDVSTVQKTIDGVKGIRCWRDIKVVDKDAEEEPEAKPDASGQTHFSDTPDTPSQ